MQSPTGDTDRARAIAYRWVQIASPKGEPLIVRVPVLATDLPASLAPPEEIAAVLTDF